MNKTLRQKAVQGQRVMRMLKWSPSATGIKIKMQPVIELSCYENNFGFTITLINSGKYATWLLFHSFICTFMPS